ncbi:IS1 family transposase [Escherichia coli]
MASVSISCPSCSARGLTLSGTKTHVKQRFLPLTPLLMVSDVLWSPVHV